MLPLEDAQSLVLSRVAALAPRRVTIDAALGLVATEAVRAAEAVPGFDNTAMDGFAVRATDTAGAPVELAVVATLAAGADPAHAHVGRGEAVRIMTGAPIPDGADAIVIVEQTAPSADGTTVTIQVAATAGDHIRHAGDDVRPGDEVVAAGTPLTAAHLGVLASVGVAEVDVVPRPRVGVLSTGDELVELGRPLGPGQIRDSNRRVLLALLSQSGFDAVDLGVARDERDTVRDAITRGVATCDALLTSGGVSMGDYDEVKAVLAEIADDMRWMQIAIRPAKPFAFGTVDGTPVFGLPGNPVSSVVSYELLARPALRAMAGFGRDALHRPRLAAVADEALRRRPDGKVHFARVVASVVEGRLHVRSAGGQGSHQLTGLANANALAVVPDGDGVAAGDEVRVLLTEEPREVAR